MFQWVFVAFRTFRTFRILQQALQMLDQVNQVLFEILSRVLLAVLRVASASSELALFLRFATAAAARALRFDCVSVVFIFFFGRIGFVDSASFEFLRTKQPSSDFRRWIRSAERRLEHNVPMAYGFRRTSVCRLTA